ncbi:hypothetical protein TeGR_g2921 [Tetraparma gracilis]|uniref:Uncharacterized protein n=1 Tax=Tetraparma gracilis TaxID=2962635 RepID=A0ABQ6MA32_9STRA|nr:hypothetical protein TeGR_g2921 [Tetraparma gracilis]
MLDHGSPHPLSSPRLSSLASLLSGRPGFLPTRHAHMELRAPSLKEAVRSLVGATGDGATSVDRVLVHPLFISPHGKHMTVDVPRLVKEAGEEARGGGWEGTVELTGCLGEDLEVLANGVVEAVKDRFLGMGGGEGEGGKSDEEMELGGVLRTVKEMVEGEVGGLDANFFL